MEKKMAENKMDRKYIAWKYTPNCAIIAKGVTRRRAYGNYSFTCPWGYINDGTVYMDIFEIFRDGKSHKINEIGGLNAVKLVEFASLPGVEILQVNKNGIISAGVNFNIYMDWADAAVTYMTSPIVDETVFYGMEAYETDHDSRMEELAKDIDIAAAAVGNTKIMNKAPYDKVKDVVRKAKKVINREKINNLSLLPATVARHNINIIMTNVAVSLGYEFTESQISAISRIAYDVLGGSSDSVIKAKKLGTDIEIFHAVF